MMFLKTSLFHCDQFPRRPQPGSPPNPLANPPAAAPPAGQRPTSRSTMLGLLFRSVFTAWNTSTVRWCRSISHTMLMAQKVPLRPPPFLRGQKPDSWTRSVLTSRPLSPENRWWCSLRAGTLHPGQPSNESGRSWWLCWRPATGARCSPNVTPVLDYIMQ